MSTLRPAQRPGPSAAPAPTLAPRPAGTPAVIGPAVPSTSVGPRQPVDSVDHAHASTAAVPPMSRSVVMLVEKAARNGFLADTEVTALRRQVMSARSTEELGHAFQALKHEFAQGLVAPPGARNTLMRALQDRQEEIRSRDGRATQTVPTIMTRAAGEDIFGIDMPDPSRTAFVRVAQNGVVTATETRSIVARFNAASDPYELMRLHANTAKLVNGNLVTLDDRRALADAYRNATQRLNGSPAIATRAMGEDVFGINHALLGSSSVQAAFDQAARNGSLGRHEAQLLARSIAELHTPEQLEAAFQHVRAHLGDVTMDLNTRRVLAQAFSDKGRTFDPNPIPVAVTRAMNEDILGIGRRTGGVEDVGVAVGTDETLSTRELSRLKKAIAAVADEPQWRDAFEHVRALVHGNVVTRDDRHALAAALTDKGADLGVYLPVTRAMGEDVFGGNA